MLQKEHDFWCEKFFYYKGCFFSWEYLFLRSNFVVNYFDCK